MKIIVIGSGRSGSGAVFDYLKGRGDLINPLNDVELRLVQDPHGIHDLYNSISNNYSITGVNRSIIEFEQLVKDYGNSRKVLGASGYYSEVFCEYDSNINQFINDITELKYSGLPASEYIKKNKFKNIYFRFSKKINRLFNSKPIMGEVRLAVSDKIFIERSQLYIDNLINYDNSNDTSINYIINQGGSFWKPLSSTQYYGDRKVIIVTRDPRDVFSELKTVGNAFPGHDVKKFCKWYSSSMNNRDLNEWKNPLIYHVKFENFVEDFNTQKVKLDDYLNINSDIKSSYNSFISKENIKKYIDILSDEEQSVISERLSKFIRE